MRGASFHALPVLKPAAAAIHNGRTWTAEHPAPGYLLPEGEGGGHWVCLDEADPVARHAEKSAMASRQARQEKNYSPVWEGVLNLPPSPPASREEINAQVKDFAERYEKITGHKVLRASIHMDEGRMEDGKPVLNGHAHIEIDRTNDQGKVIKLKNSHLSQVQDAAAEATGLERGRPAKETKRKHQRHGQWRSGAQSGVNLSNDQIDADLDFNDRILDRAEAAEKAVEKVKQEAAEKVKTAELYGELRGLMKASGTAKQADYSEAKKHSEDPDWILARIQKLEAQAAAKALAEAEAAETAKAAERAKIRGLGAGIAAAAQGDIALVWPSKTKIIFRNSEVRERLEKIIAPATKIVIGWIKKFMPERVWEGTREPTPEDIEAAFKRRPLILGGPAPDPIPIDPASVPDPIIVRAAPVLKPRRRPQFER
jgi:hypothetical protein